MSRLQQLKILGLMGSGNLFAHLITLSSLPFVARLFDTQDIGRIAIYYVLSHLLAVVFTARLEQGLFILRSNRRAQSFAIFLLILPIATAIILASGVAALFAYFGATDVVLLGVPITQTELLFFLSQTACNSAANVMRALTIRNGRYRSWTSAAVLRAAVQASLRIATGVAGLGFLGLMVAELASSLTLAVVLAALLKPRSPLSFRWTMVHMPVRTFPKVWRFAFFELPSTLIDTLTINIPLFAISYFYGASAAGQYHMAFQILSLPTAQMGTAVADLFQSTMAQHVRNSQSRAVVSLFSDYLKFLAATGSVIFVVAAVGSPWLFVLFLGAQWEVSGVVAVVMVPWMFSSFTVGPLSKMLSVFNRQHTKLQYDIACLAAMLTGSLLIFFQQPPFMLAVALFSFLNVACYLWYFYLIWRLRSELVS